MIDGWWLMADDWWVMIDDKINTNIMWNVKYRLPKGGPFHIISSMITHHSSIISHQSSVINHQLSIINHPWSMINHQSHQLPAIFFDIKKNAHLQNIKRNERKKLSPEAREKKDSSAKSLNDIKKSKRKSAKSYPRRHEKKG